MKSILISLALVWGSSAFANTIGFDRGNGGNAVVCSDIDGNETVSPLDLYELQNVYQFTLWDKLQTFSNRETYQERLFQRLEKSFPRYTRKLRTLYAELRIRSAYIEDSFMYDIRDQGITADLNDQCRLVQAAFSYSYINTRVFYYAFNATLFKKMTSAGQAILVLHELMYRHFLFMTGNSHQVNSVQVRHLVALVASEEFDSPSNQDFFKSFVVGINGN